MGDAGIALHATNRVVVVIDEEARGLYQQRLRHELALSLTALEPYRATLPSLAVESTYNWYGLVDGLMDTGSRVHRAQAPALPQSSGLKHADDRHDARWLALSSAWACSPPGTFSRKRHARSVMYCARAATWCDTRPWWSAACKAASRD
jgi:hypothetical protein